MNILRKITAWLKTRHTLKQQAREREHYDIVQQRLQLREFKGQLYISIDRIPIIATGKDPIKDLDESRYTFYTYLNQSKI